MPKVNPEILKWARTTAGLTPEWAATVLSIRGARGKTAVARLAALESGEADPSRGLLRRMARRYRRSLVAFYLDAPPATAPEITDFRKFSEAVDAEQQGLLAALVRQMRAAQSEVRALLEDERAERLQFVGSMSRIDGLPTALDKLRRLLAPGLPVRRTERAPAFHRLRDRTEALGVFVVLRGDLGSSDTDIHTTVFRGFTLADEIAPFLVINDNDAQAAWSFTLLHELTHILLGQTGVGNDDFSRREETFCEDVASRFLLPDSVLPDIADDSFDPLVSQIRHEAKRLGVNHTHLAYRLLRAGRITARKYHRAASLFKAQWGQLSSSRTSQGFRYYPVKRHRVGKGLTALARRSLRAGTLSTTGAATVPGVKPTQVGPLLEL